MPAKRFWKQGASGGRKLNPETLLLALRASEAQRRHLVVMQDRLQHARSRDDKREWVQDRRARTRHLIELGGLIQKAGLVELVDDDRATLLGALLGIADQLRQGGDDGASPADLIARWRRRGLRTFDVDKEESSSLPASGEERRPGRT